MNKKVNTFRSVLTTMIRLVKDQVEQMEDAGPVSNFFLSLLTMISGLSTLFSEVEEEFLKIKNEKEDHERNEAVLLSEVRSLSHHVEEVNRALNMANADAKALRSELNSSLVEAWALYWTFKDSDPVRASHIKEAIMPFTLMLRRLNT